MLLGPLETKVSKKVIKPSPFGFSMVNWMWGSIELMCWRNW